MSFVFANANQLVRERPVHFIFISESGMLSKMGMPDLKMGMPDLKMGTPDLKMGTPDLRTGMPGKI